MPLPAATRHVLIVEDDDSIAAALEFLVRKEGLSHERVASGAEAMARIVATRPDLVVLDVMLPEVSGYDICRTLRRDPALRAVKVLMMTARGSAQERDRALGLGADGFIAKPFDIGGMRAEVRRLLPLTP